MDRGVTCRAGGRGPGRRPGHADSDRLASRWTPCSKTRSAHTHPATGSTSAPGWTGSVVLAVKYPAAASQLLRSERIFRPVLPARATLRSRGSRADSGSAWRSLRRSRRRITAPFRCRALSGRGSVFEIVLPLAHDAERMSPALQSRRSRSNAGARAGRLRPDRQRARRYRGGDHDGADGLAVEQELVEDLLDLLHRRRVQLQQEAVFAGDAVALGDLRQAGR